MTYNNIIGIDLAKRKFHLAVLNNEGKKIAAKALDRDQVLQYLDAFEDKTALVAMEACGSCHYWSQQITKLGFQTKLMKPSDVKVYAKSKQKNDKNDALAICKAAKDPELKAVAPKDKITQDIMLLHKRRKNTIKTRIRMTNSVMSSLLEFGHLSDLSKGRFGKLADKEIHAAYASHFISESTRDLLLKDAEIIQQLYQAEDETDALIIKTNKENEKAKRLQTIPGIGSINASVLSGLAVESYRDARDFAASLGLVPSQHTTGGEIKLGAITKRGNRYARTMLIQGARSIVMRAKITKEPNDRIMKWAKKIAGKKPFNAACVAVANKLARVAYAVVTQKKEYIAC